MAEKQTFSTKFGNRELIISVGEFAERADGAVTVQYGDTVVLATAVVGKEPREGVDFLPLMVDYEERLYAAGKISGSRFIKREGRPSENAILNARLIDRSIRPLFPKNFHNDIQVIVTILSIDGDNDPDMPAMIAASAALTISSAPFQGPIGGIRVGLIDGKLVANPTMEEQTRADLSIVVAGIKDRVMMIEAGARQATEDQVLKAIEFAKVELQSVLKLITDMAKKIGQPKQEAEFEVGANEVEFEVKKEFHDQIQKAAEESDKSAQDVLVEDIETAVFKLFEGKYKQIDLRSAIETLLEKEVRTLILGKGKRPDGRKMDEIRSISSKVALLPRTHGSALFSRGQTQVLSIVTLGGPGEEQSIDTMEQEGEKRFMHHYNFPPFSVGEVSPLRGAGRREIGHGALAEKAVEPVIPSKEEFPYTIRVVSEVLSSNGSSSMASACGTSLALMDAGVPITDPVAGIAIGLITDEDFNQNDKAKYQILTDIQGIEDFGGDMDFKVAGTAKGITAIQLDMKVKGITDVIIEDALNHAKEARNDILQKMAKTINAPRPELSPYAPRITSFNIPVDKIGDIIGPGGKTIRSIIEQAGGKELVSIDIDDNGTVSVASIDAEAAIKAVNLVKGIIQEPEIGQVYEGEVVSIQRSRTSGQEVGAIVQFLPNADGMVHISEIANQRIAKVSDHVKPGQKVKVKVLEIDERGRVKLSMKAAQLDK